MLFSVWVKKTAICRSLPGIEKKQIERCSKDLDRSLHGKGNKAKFSTCLFWFQVFTLSSKSEMKTESEFWALMFLVIAIASFVAQFIQVMVFSF